MYILQYVSFINDIVTAYTKDILEGDTQKIIWGLIFFVNKFTRKINTSLDIF